MGICFYRRCRQLSTRRRMMTRCPLCRGPTLPELPTTGHSSQPPEISWCEIIYRSIRGAKHSREAHKRLLLRQIEAEKRADSTRQTTPVFWMVDCNCRAHKRLPFAANSRWWQSDGARQTTQVSQAIRAALLASTGMHIVIEISSVVWPGNSQGLKREA